MPIAPPIDTLRDRSVFATLGREFAVALPALVDAGAAIGDEASTA